MPAAQVAYFSMEIALRDDIPTYAGGLGILAGDTVRAAADLGLPMVAVTLLARKGYFHQRLDPTGWQTEEPARWLPESYLTEVPTRIHVEICGRRVQLRAWRYTVKGARGGTVDVFLLDTDLADNQESDRTLTDYLYGGDPTYRLCQEVVLGIGGVRMLRALGYDAVERYHMNEGHSSLLILELLAEAAAKAGDPVIEQRHIDAVRSLCVFTTHTPVAAGHDRFPLSLVHQVLGPAGPFQALEREYCTDGELNLTYLGLAGSHYVNGVAKSHRDTAQHMYAQYHIESITNGVHVPTWVSPPFRELFDRHIPDWRHDSMSLRYAISIAHEEIRAAHRKAKEALCRRVAREVDRELDAEAFTIGFARRATAYKRFALVFTDPDRLAAISERVGRLQLLFAGKAHPHDIPGKEMIQAVVRVAERLRGRVEIVYVPGYDMELAALMTAGVDLVAQYAAAATGGLRHQRHEGGAQRRAVPERVGRMVVGGLHRGRDRLEHRRALQQRPAAGLTAARRRRPLRKTRADHRAHVLQRTAALCRRDAPRHRAEWFLLQHRAHGQPIFHQGVFLSRGGSARRCRRGRGGKRTWRGAADVGSGPLGLDPTYGLVCRGGGTTRRSGKLECGRWVRPVGP